MTIGSECCHGDQDDGRKLRVQFGHSNEDPRLHVTNQWNCEQKQAVNYVMGRQVTIPALHEELDHKWYSKIHNFTLGSSVVLINWSIISNQLIGNIFSILAMLL